MYSYIKGQIKEIEPKNIILESNNIGYEIIVPNPYSYSVSDKIITVYIYHYLKEDLELFYGFSKKEEKDLFLKLLSVSGIGPKSALSILASASCSEIIKAIDESNQAFLKKFPGIGAKASAQIILDLKGKLTLNKENNISSEKEADLLEALISLGYQRKEITNVLKEIDLSLDTSSIIKLCLLKLNK